MTTSGASEKAIIFGIKNPIYVDFTHRAIKCAGEKTLKIDMHAILYVAFITEK